LLNPAYKPLAPPANFRRNFLANCCWSRGDGEDQVELLTTIDEREPLGDKLPIATEEQPTAFLVPGPALSPEPYDLQTPSPALLQVTAPIPAPIPAPAGIVQDTPQRPAPFATDAVPARAIAAAQTFPGRYPFPAFAGIPHEPRCVLDRFFAPHEDNLRPPPVLWTTTAYTPHSENESRAEMLRFLASLNLQHLAPAADPQPPLPLPPSQGRPSSD
jgi:hypothetical protein